MRESTLWLFFLLAALLIAVTLTIHMGVLHLDALLGIQDTISFRTVMERGKDTFYAVMYTVLLGAGLYHGLYGLRTILFELSLSRGRERTLSWAFLLFGVAMFIYGFWAIRAAYLI
jgi:succinate dehydrogenase / fumarate reductase membrane anchor subunit